MELRADVELAVDAYTAIARRELAVEHHLRVGRHADLDVELRGAPTGDLAILARRFQLDEVVLPGRKPEDLDRRRPASRARVDRAGFRGLEGGGHAIKSFGRVEAAFGEFAPTPALP